MKTKRIISLIALMGLFISPVLAQEKSPINWIDIQEVDKTLKNNDSKKRIFIDSYTDWCGWCKKMDKDTFADSLISKIMNHYFISVKFDAESKGDIIFGGKTYKNTNPNGRRSAHQLAYHLLNNRLSYPSYTVLNSDLSIATIIPGYYPPSAFETMAVFLGGEYDKQYSWEDFQKIYEKEIKPELLKALE